MSTPVQARPLRWWDLATGVVLVVLAVLGGFEAWGGSPLWATAWPALSRLIVVALPIVAFAVLYVALGRRALRRGLCDEAPDAASTLFLALLLLVLLGAVAALPIFAVLQTLVYPMAWSIVMRYRHAVLWSAATALATGCGLVLAIGSRDLGTALVSAAITVSLSFVFAVTMGTWITRIAAQGERYRALAEELRASQAEVADLSVAAGAAAERERLSRELHDTLTQTLAGLVMLSEQAERALDSGDAMRGRERLGRVSAAARDAVAEARALVATTQPLGDGGLEAAIERVALRLAEDTGLRPGARGSRPGARGRAAACGAGGARERAQARAGGTRLGAAPAVGRRGCGAARRR